MTLRKIRKDQSLVYGWYKAFIKRLPELTLEAVTRASVCITENDIKNWFTTIENGLDNDGLKDILKEGDRVFNGNETYFLLCSKNRKVIACRGSVNVYEVDQGTAKSSITVMFTFGANGSITPLMITYPYKRKLPPEILETVSDRKWGIGYSDNGWMKSSLFYEQNKRNIERVPFVITSEKWKKIKENKEEEKLSKKKKRKKEKKHEIKKKTEGPKPKLTEKESVPKSENNKQKLLHNEGKKGLKENKRKTAPKINVLQNMKIIPLQVTKENITDTKITSLKDSSPMDECAENKNKENFHNGYKNVRQVSESMEYAKEKNKIESMEYAEKKNKIESVEYAEDKNSERLDEAPLSEKAALRFGAAINSGRESLKTTLS
ncbi:hypothetical protein MML48_3g00020180 [Holotrichia oblita]|uniref:Uncharacterized protein n=1 Tax=Holotrichia oblita TaxID=644536 RepID=A0ACB9THB0_HOLOL|nr:hypothetical protein MML48_3g00020180 [Holotrichia oblita]